MSTFLQDFRYSLRQLFKNRRGFTDGDSLSDLRHWRHGLRLQPCLSVLMNPWPYQGADRIANIALLDKSGEGRARTERSADTGVG